MSHSHKVIWYFDAGMFRKTVLCKAHARSWMETFDRDGVSYTTAISTSLTAACNVCVPAEATR